MINKSTLFVLGAMLMGSTAFAAPGLTPVKSNSFKSEITRNGRTLTKTREAKKLAKAPQMKMPVNEVIINPEGTYMYYSKSVKGLDWFDPYEETDLAATIVFGANNDVYIGDVLTYYGFGSFMKGELSEGKIRVSLPQTMEYDESVGYGMDVCLLQEEDGDYVISDIDYVEYIYDEETGNITLDLPGEPEEYILGYVYTDDDSWYGDGDFTQEYTPFAGIVYEMPEDVETEEYVYNDGYFGHPVTIAFDGNDVYMKGLSYSMPEGVVKGLIDGNKVIFDQDQMVGTYYGYFIYVKCFVPDDVTDFELAPEDAVYTMEFDPEKKTLVANDPDYNFALNAAIDYVMALEIYSNFSVYYQDSFTGTPMDPFDLTFTDEYYYDYGIYGFDFMIPNISTEEKVLDMDSLYYRVFVDDELMEFEADEEEYIYNSVEGIMTEIPFLFDNGFDIGNWGFIERFIGLYQEGISTVGVQSVYIYDGETTESAVVTINVDGEEEDGVHSITTLDVVKTDFYDMNGRRVSNPDNGIYVMRQTLKNGDVVVRKVVRK